MEYWLDNGVFGQRKFVAGDIAAKSPFQHVAHKMPSSTRTVALRGRP
ncbi:MAG: hypothetical protein H0U56_08750 [Methylibium sp.]|nr:hypothetical protein [Methylibium sp.]MBA2722970.1 hypothetical protein [Methylibium sp.]MBA3589013.1 hypothetical protein [Methylibium sp.]